MGTTMGQDTVGRIYAVVTGDVVKFSRLTVAQRRTVLELLESSFGGIQSLFGPVYAPFRPYRGDSFQGVVDPSVALRAAIFLRASFRGAVEAASRSDAPDARIGVGIGTVESLPGQGRSMGDGEAFYRSGRLLDSMKDQNRLLFRTPWPEIDVELDVECALLDAIMGKWSAQQAEAVALHIRGLTQAMAAGELGISQPAVGRRLKSAGARAVDRFCSRYEELVAQARKS